MLEGRAEERAVERQEAFSRALAREVGVLWSSSRCDRPRTLRVWVGGWVVGGGVDPPCPSLPRHAGRANAVVAALSLPHALRFLLPSSRETGPEILHFVLTLCFAP